MSRPLTRSASVTAFLIDSDTASAPVTIPRRKSARISPHRSRRCSSFRFRTVRRRRSGLTVPQPSKPIGMDFTIISSIILRFQPAIFAAESIIFDRPDRLLRRHRLADYRIIPFQMLAKLSLPRAIVTPGRNLPSELSGSRCRQIDRMYADARSNCFHPRALFRIVDPVQIVLLCFLVLAHPPNIAKGSLASFPSAAAKCGLRYRPEFSRF